MKVAKDKPSIIPQKIPSECFFCGKQYDLVKHHCLHGRGIKPLAIEDGLCTSGPGESERQNAAKVSTRHFDKAVHEAGISGRCGKRFIQREVRKIL